MARETSYWRSFLAHPVNQALVFGGLLAGVLASMPFGWDALGLAILGVAALEVVGLAIVPGLPSFRESVDNAERRAARRARRAHLLEEVQSHGGSAYLKSFQQMEARVQSLYRMAADTSSALTAREVEQLDELAVAYLAMCLSDAATRQQEAGDIAAVAVRKLKGVEEELQKGGLDSAHEQQLRRARGEYQELLARQARMASRRKVLEANLVSMPVRMEEVYQMVVASPGSGDLGALLEESVAKLSAAEEVTLDVESVFRLNRETRPAVAVAQRPAMPARREAQEVGKRE